MLVSDENILKDIGNNVMDNPRLLTEEVVKDMMFYMREQYEHNMSSLNTKIKILEAALRGKEHADNEYVEDKTTGSLFDEEDLVTANKIAGEFIGGIEGFEKAIQDLLRDVINNEDEEPEDVDYPENMIFCRGVTENGTVGEVCDGRDSCKKYLGQYPKNIQENLLNSADFTNLDTCKTLQYELFEAK